ncbi:MAG TPA: (d)CMP kinase [Euzebya sp.]|nr:(d)CMP kinase [Euzebya sp.]
MTPAPSPPTRGRPLVVAIDGPAGSGKSAVSRAVAHRLGIPHVDTGAYYRAATLAVLRAGIDPADTTKVPEVVAGAVIDRVAGRTILDGEDVEEQVRGDEVTRHVSAVAAQLWVRDALLAAQQAGLARDGGVIEGRDASTRVAPDATVKVWLDADVVERARRRARQAGEPGRVAFHRVDLVRRDAADAGQMARHPEAVVVDTTGMSQEEVVATVVDLARSAAGHR